MNKYEIYFYCFSGVEDKIKSTLKSLDNSKLSRKRFYRKTTSTKTQESFFVLDTKKEIWEIKNLLDGTNCKIRKSKRKPKNMMLWIKKEQM